MRKFFFIFCPLAAVLASGCATMSPDQCAVADWYQVGYKDGGEGRPRQLIEDHARACTKAGLNADRDRYFAGHEQGVLYYCTPSNGYRVGREGRQYADVCPPHLAPGFLEPYRHGREIHSTRSRIDGLERSRRERENRLATAKTDEERRRLRNELLDIDHNLRRERGKLSFLERGNTW